MNIKTATNINADLSGLIKHYLAAGREIPADGYPVAVTAANIKNLAYYRYTHGIDGTRYSWRLFNDYLDHFRGRHVIDGFPLHHDIGIAGVGRVKVLLVEHDENSKAA